MEAPFLGREQRLPLEYEIISAAQLSRLRNKNRASELLLLGVSRAPTSAGIPRCEPITQDSGYFQNVLCGSERFVFLEAWQKREPMAGMLGVSQTGL